MTTKEKEIEKILKEKKCIICGCCKYNKGVCVYETLPEL